MASPAALARPKNSLLARFLHGLHPQADIPLRLTLWNGWEHDFSADPHVTIRLPGPKALRYFVPPSLDNLA